MTTYQSIDVHDSDVCTWVSVDDFCQVRRLVLEDSVDQRNVFEHLVADLGDVARLVRPVLRTRQSTLTRKPVLWGQVQRCHVLQDEVTTTIVVDALNGIEHTVGVVDDGGAGDLCIRNESVVAKIIGSDEDAVNGLVLWDVQELCAILVDIFRVCNVGRDLILLHGWERCIDRGEGARGDVVTADSARHGVVVDIRAGVLRDVLWPGATAVGRMVVLQIYLAMEPKIGISFDSLQGSPSPLEGQNHCGCRSSQASSRQCSCLRRLLSL